MHPWTHASATAGATAGATEASVYMIIRNHGSAPDRLLAAATARAGQALLVTAARRSFAVKPGGELKLDRTAGYIRLTGLTKPMHTYDSFPMTLVFEKAGRVDVEVQVEEASVQQPHKH